MRRVGALLAALLLLPLLAACNGGEGAKFELVPSTATPPAQALPLESLTPIPPPELVLSAVETSQAGAILVSVVGDVSAGRAVFLGRTYELTQGTQSMYAFVAVGVEDPTGEQPLRVEFTLSNGTRGTLSETIWIYETYFPVDEIEVPDDRKDLLAPGVAERDEATLRAVYARYTPEKLWDSTTWVVPTIGALTTQFGEGRSYDGGEPETHHGGTDIGAEEGAPVVAMNRGRVVLVLEMGVYGKTIAIDHGGGVVSAYSHLSDFAVREGEMVEAGALIGYVGNTGLSTGPHLHWELAIGGVRVDPLWFTDGTNGF